MTTENPEAATVEQPLTLRIRREFRAPRTLVWQAWTQREHLARWFCPHAFTVTSVECDLRPGGAWRSVMQSPDGTDYIHYGVYHEINEPERLVLTHAWEENEQEREACQTALESLITVTLSERGDGITEMLFEQIGFTSPESRDAHEGGWSEAFDNLGDFVQTAPDPDATLAPGSNREIVITRLFDAPRERLWKAWTEPEHIARWWGPPGFDTVVEQHELRPGGGLRYVMTDPDGTRYPIRGRFREIVPNERLVHSLDFAEDFPPMDHATLPGGLLVTVTFDETPLGTRLTARLLAESEDDRQRHESMGVVPGWAITLDGLAAHLVTMAPEQAGREGRDTGRGLSIVVGTDSSLTLIRCFAAAREQVFEATVTPALLKQWCYGPDGFSMPVCEEDPRPGGRSRWEWRGPGDMAMTMTGTYREVDPPRRIVREETFETGCEAQAGTQLATLELAEEGELTVLKLALRYPSAQARDAALVSGMEHGMAASYDRLARLLEPGAITADNGKRENP